jgi:hypothetical protein
MRLKHRRNSITSKGSYSKKPKKSKSQPREGMKNIVDNILNITSSID